MGICARGFRRTSWLRHLLELRQAYVVRLIPDVLIYQGSSGGRPLRDWQLAPGQGEPWWLATDLAAPLVELLALDDRRMVIEAQFRETKGRRPRPRLRRFPWLQALEAVP